jgi:hypothetical protein
VQQQCESCGAAGVLPAHEVQAHRDVLHAYVEKYIVREQQQGGD